jgi:hypothetical protein
VKPAPTLVLLPVVLDEAEGEVHADFMAVANMPEELQGLVLMGLVEKCGLDLVAVHEEEILYVRMLAIAELTDHRVAVSLEDVAPDQHMVS